MPTPPVGPPYSFRTSLGGRSALLTAAHPDILVPLPPGPHLPGLVVQMPMWLHLEGRTGSVPCAVSLRRDEIPETFPAFFATPKGEDFLAHLALKEFPL